MSDDLEETRFGLKFLHAKALADHDASRSTKRSWPLLPDLSGRVYDLECLVVALSDERLTFAQASEEVLSKYSFDYAANTKCTYHTHLDTINCALGVVKRKAYLISDHLCPLYGIEVTARHLPIETHEGEVVDDLNLSELRRRFSLKFRMAADSSRYQPCYDIR